MSHHCQGNPWSSLFSHRKNSRTKVFNIPVNWRTHSLVSIMFHKHFWLILCQMKPACSSPQFYGIILGWQMFWGVGETSRIKRKKRKGGQNILYETLKELINLKTTKRFFSFKVFIRFTYKPQILLSPILLFPSHLLPTHPPSTVQKG